MYVGFSSAALVLVIVNGVLAFLYDSGGKGPVVRWGTYVIQDWGNGACSEGIRIDDIQSCRDAFRLYKDKCETRDEGPQVENWDGQPGCHMQDAGFAEFQFNTNLRGKNADNHAPVCKIGRVQQSQCYNEEAVVFYYILNSIVAVFMYIPPIVMAVSRLCAPACCPGGMELVPGCCPCNCFVQLDTPYYVAGGVIFLIGFAEMFLPFAEYSSVRLLSVWIVLSAVVTTIVKFFIMAGCCCQHCKPQLHGAPQQHGQPVVVGQPVIIQAVGQAIEPTKP